MWLSLLHRTRRKSTKQWSCWCAPTFEGLGRKWCTCEYASHSCCTYVLNTLQSIQSNTGSVTQIKVAAKLIGKRRIRDRSRRWHCTSAHASLEVIAHIAESLLGESGNVQYTFRPHLEGTRTDEHGGRGPISDPLTFSRLKIEVKGHVNSQSQTKVAVIKGATRPK